MKLSELIDYTGQLLQIERFRDYCPNGLQVAGRAEIRTLVSGVTASMALLERAAALDADLVLVHHGWFWKGEDPCVVGIKKNRLKFLLERDIGLAAYHLPLDAHPELGNNARLAQVLDFTLQGWVGEQSLVAHGTVNQPGNLREVASRIAQRLGRQPLVFGDADKQIRNIAWCTGAAQDFMDAALALGVDAFLTGEVSERTFHIARETGIAFISAGHHATERYGIQALGGHLAERYQLVHHFVDIDNPV
ncbi:MAG: Nif3-like dinuclear metal center hexameric protein [Methylobacillus sp.]|jgi:dinuclear metal center YbgI/SA1388 family protein|nr:Nif3-like dinuclear metal center hexameric protein [Methylobacillus sp.]